MAPSKNPPHPQLQPQPRPRQQRAFVPDTWMEAMTDVNWTKKEKKKISYYAEHRRVSGIQGAEIFKAQAGGSWWLQWAWPAIFNGYFSGVSYLKI